MDLERRFLPAAELRVMERDDGETVISGYAVRYNERSVLLWDFYEEIAAGAFGESLEGDIRALWQHDTSQVLGRTVAGTLKIWDDAEGVAFELTPADTQAGRDAVASIRRGDIDQMSFGFRVLPNGAKWLEDSEGTLLRRVVNATLIEISPVTWAAYPSTSVGVRTDDIYGIIPEIPDGLRAQTDGDSETAGEDARARMATRRRRLDLAELEA